MRDPATPALLPATSTAACRQQAAATASHSQHQLSFSPCANQSRSVPPPHPPPNQHSAAKYEREAGRYWDLFYQRNETKFFRDRHYFGREFPQLLAAQTVLEVGRPGLAWLWLPDHRTEGSHICHAALPSD